MQRTRRAVTAAHAIVLVALVLLAGCEIGVEETATSRPEVTSADGAVEARPSVEAPIEPDAGSWHAAEPRAARTSAKAKPERGKLARGKLNFVEGYQAGYQLAAEQSKPLLLFFTAQWCRYCHQMAQEAFTHPQVIALSHSFVCVLVDADQEPAVCRQFGVTGYPTIQFVSPRGVPLERVVGKKPGHQLIIAMRAALQSVAHHEDDDSVSR